MSRFQTAFTDRVVTAANRAFGQTVTVTRPDGTEHTVTGRYTREVAERRETEQGFKHCVTRKLKIAAGLHADFAAATSKVANMTATIDSVTYSVESFKRDGVDITLMLVREGLHERTRRNYR